MTTNNVKKVWASGKAVVNAWLAIPSGFSAEVTAAALAALQADFRVLSIERDFGRTLEYVELDDANANAFSDAYAKLLLLIGSEVDVVAKMLCNKVASTQKAENIGHYQTILTHTSPACTVSKSTFPDT